MEAEAAPAEITLDMVGALEELFDLAVPHPKYKALLEAGGVACPMDGVVLVTGRNITEETLRNSQRFSSAAPVNLGNVRPLIPLNVDPPSHLRYRKILDPLFAPKRMELWEHDITARVNAFLDGFVDRGSCHFTDEFATPFPSSVFLALMGLPEDELSTFLRFKNCMLRPRTDGTTPEEVARMQQANGVEVYAYFNAILDERAKQPRRDILTQFLHAEVDGEKLTREEILDICFLMLIAGLDTVTDTLTCSWAFLAQHPEHRAQVVADPSVIPSAVEELLRWESPVAQILRMATVDTELAGHPVKAGSMIFLMLGGANVDPAEYPDGFDVRFDREVNRHMAFGGGIHRCLGSHLARRELRIAMREWHRRIPEYRVKPGIELHYPMGFRSVENLELEWGPR